jgi:hypothetical protein
MHVETYRAARVLSAIRSGSSLPVVVDTPAGRHIVKLRGAAHGTAALVAEIVVAELAERLGLNVPARAFLILDDALVSDDRNDELADLLTRSRGLNLAFQWLPAAHDLRPDDARVIDEDTASAVVWLDWHPHHPSRRIAHRPDHAPCAP